MSSDAIIKVDNLSKCYNIYEKPRDRLLQMLARGRRQYYREFWALRDISFEVKKGETVGIIGRNGSGKSTLLQLICGTLNPTAGSIKTVGRIAALLELGSGFNPEFTGRENIFMSAAVFGFTPEQTEARFDDIAAFADIGEFIEQPVKMYSSGMYVRLAFALIAHVDADILIIDEALAVGDAFFTQKCMRFIRKFREEHSLLFVSHDTSSVINLCDRAIWLNKGVMQDVGPSKLVCEEYLNSLFRESESASSETGSIGMEVDRPKSDQVKIKRIGDTGLAWRDQRQSIVNASTSRNDLEIFKFKADTTTEFGGEEARITNVTMTDSEGYPLSWVVGGEKVCLRVEAQALADLRSPIIGFFIRDRLGQTLFGDNTYVSYANRPLLVSTGNSLVAEFEFYMPWLANGDYIVLVALSEGTQSDHRRLHWLHDALAFRSHHDPLSTGIMGIPMIDIRLQQM